MSEQGGEISNSSGLNSGAEPSMEEILASIRRILKEDEAEHPAKVDLDDDVLVLDSSMLARPVDLSSATTMPPAEPPPPLDTAVQPGAQHIASEPAFFAPSYRGAAHDADPAPASAYYSPAREDEMPENVEPPDGLMSNEASSKAASSVGALIRSISSERSAAVTRGGLTIEDIVREEIRPILKAWLDSHLPSLVERIVRAEIERVVDRGTGN